MSIVINIDELLPLVQKYQELYWRRRGEELKGYLFDFDLREKLGAGEITEEQAEEATDAFCADRSNDLHWEAGDAEIALLQLLRGESPAEVTKLQDEVLEKYGEG